MDHVGNFFQCVTECYRCATECYEFVKTQKEKMEKEQPFVETEVIEMETLPVINVFDRIRNYQQVINLTEQLGRFSDTSLLGRGTLHSYTELENKRRQLLGQLGIDYKVQKATKELWIYLKKIGNTDRTVVVELYDEFKKEMTTYYHQGADLNLCPENKAILMLSQVAHIPELVRLLFDLGASFDLKDGKGKNILNFLIDKESTDLNLLLYALENNADPDIPFDVHGCRKTTLLHRIAWMPPQGECFSEILGYCGSFLNDKDYHGETPLDKVLLCRSKEHPILENAHDLIQAGAKLRDQTYTYFQDMILAMWNKKWTEKELEVVKFFMGKEPLKGFLHEIIEMEGVEDLICTFAVSGVSLSRPYLDETPLAAALKKQKVKNAEALVKYGALVDHESFERFLELEKGRPSYLYHPDIGRELAAQIFFTSYHQEEGWTDLAYTAAFGIHDRLKSILSIPKVETSERIEALGGKTALDLAIERNQLYSAYLLFSKDADFTIRPKDQMHSLLDHLHHKKDLRYLINKDSMKAIELKAKDRKNPPYDRLLYAHILREYQLISRHLDL